MRLVGDDGVGQLVNNELAIKLVSDWSLTLNDDEPKFGEYGADGLTLCQMDGFDVLELLHVNLH
jgi:hypothetical protein